MDSDWIPGANVPAAEVAHSIAIEEESHHLDSDGLQQCMVAPAVASLSLAMCSLLSLPHFSPARSLEFAPLQRKLESSPLLKVVKPEGKTTNAVKADTSFKRSVNSGPALGAPLVHVHVGPPVARVARKSASSISPFPDHQRLIGADFGVPRNIAAWRRTTIVWFRNDLRVHDNEALSQASDDSISIVPVYCFDPRDYGKSSSGFDKTGPYRAKFLLECVACLRESLRARGSELIVRVGKPEEVLVTVANAVGADAMYAHMEVSHEETKAEESVSKGLSGERIESKFFWGSTLFHVDDLPFRLEEMPSNYGGFRDKVQGLQVRAAVAAPQQLKGLPADCNITAGDIPTLQELGLSPSSLSRPDKSSAHGAKLTGGEDEALQRLGSFVEEASRLVETKARNFDNGADGLYGANFSCKISPWLAMGCLSPRRMFEDLNKNVRRVCLPAARCGEDANGPLNWLVFELLWRDFFRFITKKFSSGKKNSLPATACTGSLAAA